MAASAEMASAHLAAQPALDDRHHATNVYRLLCRDQHLLGGGKMCCAGSFSVFVHLVIMIKRVVPNWSPRHLNMAPHLGIRAKQRVRGLQHRSCLGVRRGSSACLPQVRELQAVDVRVPARGRKNARMCMS